MQTSDKYSQLGEEFARKMKLADDIEQKRYEQEREEEARAQRHNLEGEIKIEVFNDLQSAIAATKAVLQPTRDAIAKLKEITSVMSNPQSYRRLCMIEEGNMPRPTGAQPSYMKQIYDAAIEERAMLLSSLIPELNQFITFYNENVNPEQQQQIKEEDGE
jgi:hypothetical protein